MLFANCRPRRRRWCNIVDYLSISDRVAPPVAKDVYEFEQLFRARLMLGYRGLRGRCTMEWCYNCCVGTVHPYWSLKDCAIKDLDPFYCAVYVGSSFIATPMRGYVLYL